MYLRGGLWRRARPQPGLEGKQAEIGCRVSESSLSESAREREREIEEFIDNKK